MSSVLEKDSSTSVVGCDDVHPKVVELQLDTDAVPEVMESVKMEKGQNNNPIWCRGTSIEVSHLSYAVRVGRNAAPKQILHDVSFNVQPGQLVALMGPSGSGKSTLMDLLADRKEDGEWSGEIFFNHKTRSSNFHRDNAYVLQDDLHIAFLTVWETLWYAGKLRMSEDTTPEQLNTRVDRLLEFMGLSHVAQSLVGDANVKGISGGQMKRLSIAVEMVALPEVIFLDEPTSGLDSAVANDTMTVVRNLANMNRTVITTIHQPSPEIFELFDLVVLIVAGRLAYFGPATDVIPYFSSPELRFHYPEGRNPAEYMIDCCESRQLPQGRHVGYTPDELRAVYRKSEYYYEPVLKDIREKARLNWESENIDTHTSQSTYALSRWSQAKVLIRRTGLVIFRQRFELMVELFKNAILGVVKGLVYFEQGKFSPPMMIDETTMSPAVTNLNSMLYFAVISSIISNAQAIPYLVSQNAIFRRECNSKTYSVGPYWFAQMVYVIPRLLINTMVFTVCAFFLVGYRTDAEYFFYFYLVIALCSLISYYFSMMLAAAFGTNSGALAVFPLTYLIFSNFAGYAIRLHQLPPFWREWAPYISYVRWAYQGLMVNQWDMYKDDMPEGSPTILEMYDFEDYDKWWTMWILVVYTVLVGFSVLLAMLKLPSSLKKVAPLPELKEDIVAAEAQVEEAGNIKAQEDAEAEAAVQHSIVDGFVPQTLVWANVEYFVDYYNQKNKQQERLHILKGISGHVKPTEMCALMGASGAGKSTLLDVLADRKTTGDIVGTMQVNGVPRTTEIMANAAYVMQDSILYGVLTVEETLMYSALLRLPQAKSYEWKVEQVKLMMSMLGISHIAGNTVGEEGLRGISGGQKKRLSIGIEIIHSPAMIFLDEPTTGLDSAVSFEVMSAVRRLATQNRTVISTIHQPSPETFALFDTLMLLSYGRVMYFGKVSDSLKYFTEGPLRFPYKEGSNVADFVICVAAAGVPTVEGVSVTGDDMVKAYEESPLAIEFNQTISDLLNHETKSSRASTRAERANLDLYPTSTLHQTMVLLRRTFIVRMRGITLSLLPVIRFILIGVFIGTLYFDLGDGTDSSVYISRLALGFFCFQASVLAHQQNIPDIIGDRAMYYRESGAYAYRVFPYWLSRIIVTLFVSMVYIACLLLPLYFLAGLRDDAESWWFFYYLLLISDACGLFHAYILAAVCPTVQVALNLYPILLFFLTLFAGFIIYLPTFPDWLHWISYLTYIRYAYQAYAISQLADNSDLPLGSQYIEMMGFDNMDRTTCACIMLAFAFGWSVVSYVMTKSISFEKR